MRVYNQLNDIYKVAHHEKYLHILHDHINICWSINHFIEADNVWMHEELQDFDFSSYCRSIPTPQEDLWQFLSYFISLIRSLQQLTIKNAWWWLWLRIQPRFQMQPWKTVLATQSSYPMCNACKSTSTFLCSPLFTGFPVLCILTWS